MANGFNIKEVIKAGQSQSVTASATTAVSNVFVMSSEDSRNILADITFSAIGETTGASVVLQDSPDGSTWSTVKSATLTTVANVDTITFAAKAGTTAGDYVVIYDTTGQAWAVAADVTGADAAPTGAIWTAIGASYKTQANISADTTAAQVAARFETAFNSLTGFSSVITSDDTAADGTMLMTAVIAGVNSDAGVVKNADDSGAGSIAVAATTAGSFTTNYELNNNLYTGSDTATWPLCRIAVTTQSGDTATVSSCKITRRL